MKKITIYTLFALAMLGFWYCDKPVADDNSLLAGADTRFLNLHDSVKYMGMQTCRSCHDSIYQSFQYTGMGESFGQANPPKSAATFDAHSVVYDKDLDYYYFPFWKDSILHIKEFRLENGDTIHLRVEKIAYIIGSGHHTNSHLINQNGYVYQAPITFYTQETKWDLAPGFEGGANSRFTRIITSECLTCHNHYPTPIEGGENKFAEMPHGIECERCHGAGSLHVKDKLAGKNIDTQKEPDFTIVNPRRLDTELQLDLCQRCHLQGVAVLKENRTWYDFRPAMPLKNVMNVFLPRYTNSDKRYIMASQADRMRLSKCYTVGKMTCINCHNPHKSIRETGTLPSNKACIKCHIKGTDAATISLEAAANKVCKAPTAERTAKQNDCANCHLPKTGSIDIPHVRITDHFIGKPINKEEQSAVARFLGLACLTKNDAKPLEMAQGYIALYEKFVPDNQMLDSAKMYLDRCEDLPVPKQFNTRIHYHYLTSNFQAIIDYAKDTPAETVTDGWTNYRIGQAFYQMQQLNASLPYLERAVKLMPYYIDFRNKLAMNYLVLKQYKKAEQELQFSLKENEKQPVVLSNMGYLLVLKGNTTAAMQYYNKALALDPDYDQAILNKAALLRNTNKRDMAKQLLEIYLKRHPKSQSVQQALQTI